MNAIARWATFCLLLCAAGGVGLRVIAVQPKGATEPRNLPSTAREAQPLDAHQLRRLPPIAGDGDIATLGEIVTRHNDPGVRGIAHHVPLAMLTANAAIAADSTPTTFQIQSPSGILSGVPSEMVFTNQRTIKITGTYPPPLASNRKVALFVGGSLVARDGNASWTLSRPDLPVGQYTIAVAQVKQGENSPIPETQTSFEVSIRTTPLTVVNVDESALSGTAEAGMLRVRFNTKDIPSPASGTYKDMFTLIAINPPAKDPKTSHVTEAKLDEGLSSVVLTVGELSPALYRLTIKGGADGLKDRWGNLLAGNDPNDAGKKNYVYDILKPVAAALPSVRPGITGSTGPSVSYHEYTAPRETTVGFNPSDKVESRVARLYYYRDAHRVAQIVNRKVQSYNRAGVDMQRQLADKARTLAEQKTLSRQHAERSAIQAAQKSRDLEHQLQTAEESLNRTVQELAIAQQQEQQQTPPNSNTKVTENLKTLANSLASRITSLRNQVESQRDKEVEQNEQAQQMEGEEQLARAEQFRREVAAAHADPDTYAPGEPDSFDPVQQVSVSVIGEGLIHLRGPLKGINIIRTMIDQIDAPLGQVRVSVHTIQINGEKADRMEVVAKQIQQYIDHARFLTMQSSEMLRKAVVQVASRKAEEARALFPGDTQEDRDQRYLYAFFGKDFIDELQAMDSEFLRSGNKLLSLHSMDTTSLSSALNLMALAKNSTREEIFYEFDAMLQGQLPQSEANYFEAGASCKLKPFQYPFCPPKFCAMAKNAKFESLRGFFNTQIAHDDTMTPLQREFVRLAQIFKSRLITELEFKQRVMERALIEDRICNYTQELQDACEKEREAKTLLQKARTQLADRRSSVLFVLTQVEAEMNSGLFATQNVLTTTKNDTLARLKSAKEGSKEEAEAFQAIRRDVRTIWQDHLQKYKYTGQNLTAYLKLKNIANSKDYAEAELLASENKAKDTLTLPEKSQLDEESNKLLVSKYRAGGEFKDEILSVVYNLEILATAIASRISLFQAQADELRVVLSQADTDIRTAYEKWVALRHAIEESLWLVGKDAAIVLQDDLKLLQKADDDFKQLLNVQFQVVSAEEKAQLVRRPLDHKKLLDMLVDDLEEKYIELLDGTRAQTANVDNYLKRLTTALDDDFNTQFYFPTFRYVRGMSTSWDVQFGQTETTSILANNREFAKVEPSATIEFDLPKRDILLSEAINGAKEMMDDVGALANDPSFLAMAKMKSGGSTASPSAGSTGGAGVMRSVLPGLSTSTAEQVMSQNANGGNQFGSNLENLIPDPAIYKFETGTGYEIRPVIQPDGQAVVFDFNYMYSTNIREPVRADEKHLGRVKRHYIDTDVQLSNFELREVSRYSVALKAARTSKGVPLFEDIPLVGVLFRPLPSAESSLQQNLIMAQATIFPTLFDLMGLRWAPVVADLDPLRLANADFIVRNRHRVLQNRVYDESSSYVDKFLRIPEAERRMDLYRTQETIRSLHPNGYEGPGMNLRDSQLQEGYQPERAHPQEKFAPAESREGAPFRPGRGYGVPQGKYIEQYPLENIQQGDPVPQPQYEPDMSSRRLPR